MAELMEKMNPAELMEKMTASVIMEAKRSILWLAASSKCPETADRGQR
jgi:hypothetical protein